MRKVWITNGIVDKEITKLFNESQSTNFTFKIPNWDNKRTTEINSLMNTRGSSDVKGCVQKILEYGYDLNLKVLIKIYSKII